MAEKTKAAETISTLSTAAASEGIRFTTRRIKPLAELRADDIPPGLDPDLLATDLGIEED